MPSGGGPDACGPVGRRRFLGILGGALAAGAGLGGCDVREYARRHGAKQRLSVATGPVGGAYYVIGGGVAQVISAYVPNVEATAEVTSATADNLRFLGAGRADLAFTIGPTLRDAYDGTGVFATFGRVPVRALLVLYAQPIHVVSLSRHRVRTIADLRGKVVSVGQPGSGTEDVASRLLIAAGLDPASDIVRHRLSPGPAAEALREGRLDAFMWSAGVPTASILELATSVRGEMTLVPTAELVPALQRRYGAGLFHEVVIPRTAYPGQAADVPCVGVSNVLVVDEAMSEPLAYEITQALLDHRAELAAIHPAARELTLASAVTDSPVPFHPGAIRYFRERGAWPS